MISNSRRGGASHAPPRFQTKRIPVRRKTRQKSDQRPILIPSEPVRLYA
jgi:hypothetical protein